MVPSNGYLRRLLSRSCDYSNNDVLANVLLDITQSLYYTRVYAQ